MIDVPDNKDMFEFEGFSDESLKVKEVPLILPVNKKEFEQKNKKKKLKYKNKEEKVYKHFDELIKIVEQVHEKLVKQNSPYRFCIYKKDDKIFIDVVILDKNGKIGQLIHKDISYENFITILNEIEQGKGLFFEKFV